MQAAAYHKLVSSFPHVEPGTLHGAPAYRAFGKFFTRLRAEDDSIVLGQISFEEREVLCEADPETFHFTDHYRNYPFVLARLKRIDAKRLRGYLERQWRHNAPKKWLKAWDAGTDLPPLTIKAPRKRARKTR